MAQKDENVLINELTLNRYQSQTKKILDNSLNVPKVQVFKDSGADSSSSSETTAAQATQTSIIWSKVLDAIGTQMKLEKDIVFSYAKSHHIVTFSSPNSNTQDFTVPNLSGGQPIPKAIVFIRIAGDRGTTSEWHGVYEGSLYDDSYPFNGSYSIYPIAYLVLTIQPPTSVYVEYDVAACGIYSGMVRDTSDWTSPMYYTYIQQGTANDSVWGDSTPLVTNNGYAQWQSNDGGYMMPMGLTLTLPKLEGNTAGTGCLYGSYECFVF